jgi:hypothetical protein
MTTWFSAMLRFVIYVDDGPVQRYRNLVLLRSTDHKDATRRAVTRGRELERSYLGGTGERVTWRLETVETIDQLGADLRDGSEVYGEPVAAAAAGEPLPPLTDLDPDTARPNQSGV